MLILLIKLYRVLHTSKGNELNVEMIIKSVHSVGICFIFLSMLYCRFLHTLLQNNEQLTKQYGQERIFADGYVDTSIVCSAGDIISSLYKLTVRTTARTLSRTDKVNTKSTFSIHVYVTGHFSPMGHFKLAHLMGVPVQHWPLPLRWHSHFNT